MARPSFGYSGFLIRWAIALVLVFATFNPEQYSYFHWVAGYGTGPEGGAAFSSDNIALKILAGVVLVILYVIYLRATWRSIGPIGLSLAAVFFGAVVWVLIDFNILDLYQSTVMAYVILFILATILAIGISWSHVRRRVSGQADIDDVDE
jgi:uncharacterized membrane protein (GlpM family)